MEVQNFSIYIHFTSSYDIEFYNILELIPSSFYMYIPTLYNMNA